MHVLQSVLTFQTLALVEAGNPNTNFSAHYNRHMKSEQKGKPEGKPRKDHQNGDDWSPERSFPSPMAEVDVTWYF